MDPLSITGSVVAIGQIIKAIYDYGSAVKDAQFEIARLRSELFGLKAALEHISWSMNSRADERANDNFPKMSTDEKMLLLQVSSDSVQSRLDRFTPCTPVAKSSPFWSPLLETEETANTLRDAKEILQRLAKALGEPHNGRKVHVLQRVTWPLKRSETGKLADSLERIKTYLVLATTSDNYSVCQQVCAEVKALRRELSDHLSQRQLAQTRQTILTRLFRRDPDEFQASAIANYHKDTGRWFQDYEFSRWSKDNSLESDRALWLRGKPGSGKTTLFASCVEKLKILREENQSTQYAFFYCLANDELTLEPSAILGSFVAQLCKNNADLWPLVEHYNNALAEEHTAAQKRANLHKLKQLIIDMCTRSERTLLLLDAPNESPSSDAIVDTFMSILNHTKSARLLITSTEEPNSLDQQPKLVRRVNMDVVSIQADIESYIESCIVDIPKLRRLPALLKDEIKQSLVAKSDGSFRWAYCQVDAISRQKSPKEIRLALFQVPHTLEETYLSILHCIPKEDQEVAYQSLQWLSFALRPLTLSELAEAAVLSSEEPTIEPDARLLDPESILLNLKSIIRYDESTGTVALSHESVRTFLTSSQALKMDVARFQLDTALCRIDLACKCIKYLSLPAFSGGPCDISKLGERFADWPLLRYAAHHWSGYVKQIMAASDGELPPKVIESIRGFFHTFSQKSSGSNFAAWYQSVFPKGSPSTWASHPLYTAAREGLAPIVEEILQVEGQKSLERRGGWTGSTPLHIAAAFGRTAVVRQLLAAGANPNEVNSLGDCGLNWAQFYGHTDVVRALIEAGADARRITHGVGRPTFPHVLPKFLQKVTNEVVKGFETTMDCSLPRKWNPLEFDDAEFEAFMADMTERYKSKAPSSAEIFAPPELTDFSSHERLTKEHEDNLSEANNNQDTLWMTARQNPRVFVNAPTPPP